MPTRRDFVRAFGAVVISTGMAGLLTQPTPAHADDEDTPVDEAVTDDETPTLADQLAPYLGLPYIWGSADGRTYFGPYPRGFDCSGWASYVTQVFLGAEIPAQTAGAWSVTVPTSDPQPGDYAFWNMRYASPRLQHMAIYLGDGQIVQAGGTRMDVNIANAWSNGTPSFRRLPA